DDNLFFPNDDQGPGEIQQAAMKTRGFLLLSLLAVTAAANTTRGDTPSAASTLLSVKSNDGTTIAVECAGAGPALLIVHGGTGDRSRWKPLLPLFAPHFKVCAMDRRGHGASGDSSDYSLRKEAEDVASVVNALRGKVFVLGHSYGAVASLEAAFLTKNIAKLVLYEPPLLDRDHTVVADKMEDLIRAGQREQAAVAFMREIVMISPAEVAVMRTRASWPNLVESIDSSLRQIRALNTYRFNPGRMHELRLPTLLLTGSETASPELKEAIQALRNSLPRSKVYVFEGQQHNAMDTVPGTFANVVTNFLLPIGSPRD
ncbi:MAG TPA: alpha/beta hydrolase, partial [Gemmatimonadaceae bacterium]